MAAPTSHPTRICFVDVAAASAADLDASSTIDTSDRYRRAERATTPPIDQPQDLVHVVIVNVEVATTLTSSREASIDAIPCDQVVESQCDSLSSAG